MCYSTQREYLNSNRDFLEVQFKGMTFPGKASLLLAGKWEDACWHPIKFAVVSHPGAYEWNGCVWMGRLPSGQSSKMLFGDTQKRFTCISTFTFTSTTWRLYIPFHQMRKLKYRECFPTLLSGEPDQNSGLLSPSEEIWKWQPRLPFNECSKCQELGKMLCTCHLI